MSAAARLRRLDEQAEITVYEMSEHVSYANCGLPYFVSDVISRRDNLLLPNQGKSPAHGHRHQSRGQDH
jgi:NADPH-dependent 2,4-dienoyl-CoA reductase/sulfur reductase-like enzyme